MANLGINYNEKVIWRLSQKGYGSIDTDIFDWKKDGKTIKRNETENYDGVIGTVSNTLKFPIEASEWIKNVIEIFDVNAKIRCQKFIINPDTNLEESSYYGYLDNYSYTIEDDIVSMNFTTGGLHDDLKNNESEKVEIERLTTLNGEPLPELQTIQVQNHGRDIYLISVSESNPDDFSFDLFDIQDFLGQGGDYLAFRSFPMKVKYDSDDGFASTYSFNSFTSQQPNPNFLNRPSIDNFFYKAQSVGDRIFNFIWNFKVKEYYSNQISVANINVVCAIYDNSIEGEYHYVDNSLDILWSYAGDGGGDVNSPSQIVGQSFSGEATKTINLDENQVVLFGFMISGAGGSGENSGGEGFLQYVMDEENLYGYVKQEEDSQFPTTTNKAILAHELAERIIKILTGKENAFYSEALGRTDLGYEKDGFASLTGFCHGQWIRNFDKDDDNEIDEQNRYKAFTTSFADFMDSLATIWNLSWGIEAVGYKERIRIEPKEFFFNQNITINVDGQLNNVKRSIAKEFYYSSIEIGYEKPSGDRLYEEAMGLDEYNGKSTYTTPVEGSNVYKSISPYRTDSYGHEFTRRKQRSDFPTEDNSRDQDIFALDLKRYSENLFKLRRWQDDFNEAPTGVFSPNTAFNLRFSPLNLLLRKGAFISAGVFKFPDKFIRYASSNVNSNLTTKLSINSDFPYIKGNEYSENGVILIDDLLKPKYIPRWIDADFPIDFNLEKEIIGSKIINGKQVSNFYGLIHFINEENQWEKGFLFEVKFEGKSDWKILKSFR